MSGYTCNNWTSAADPAESAYGVAGNVSNYKEKWSYWDHRARCDNSYRIYCFQSNESAPCPPECMVCTGDPDSGIICSCDPDCGATPTDIPTPTPTTPAGPEGWYHSDWSYRKSLTVDAGKVAGSGSHGSFPILVKRTDGNWKTTGNGGHVSQSDGGDIVFTAGDGTTKLDHEIEKYSASSGELVAWVKIPSLSTGTDTQIYVYYGNASLAGGSNQWNPTGVWSDGYQAAYHLHNDEADSTDNHDGTNSGSDNAGGRVADGQDFEANDSSDKIGLGTWSVSGNKLTLQAWVKFESFATDDARLISKAKEQDANDHVFMLSTISSGGQKRLRARIKTGTSDGSGTATAIATSGDLATGQWYLASVVYDGSKIKLYLNGNQVGSESKSGNLRQNNWEIQLGNNPYSDPSHKKPLDGILDEVRISSKDRSSDWLKTEFNNQNDPNGFFKAVGGEERK